MSRTPMTFDIPDPPEWLELSTVPDKTVEQAAEWITALGPKVTVRYIRAQTDKCELRCQVIAGVRYYSTRNLWDFLMTRKRTKAAKDVKRQDIHAGRVYPA